VIAPNLASNGGLAGPLPASDPRSRESLRIVAVPLPDGSLLRARAYGEPAAVSLLEVERRWPGGRGLHVTRLGRDGDDLWVRRFVLTDRNRVVEEARASDPDARAALLAVASAMYRLHCPRSLFRRVDFGDYGPLWRVGVSAGLAWRDDWPDFVGRNSMPR
jgi:hypothetical protein